MGYSLLAFGILACALSLLLPQNAFAQIPAVCTDPESLENSVCCPSTSDGVCGKDAGRGACEELDTASYSYSSVTKDVRRNWPHYFTRVCECSGNYAGYDCSRCKFGYYGPGCSQMQVLPRKPLRELTDEDWTEFRDIIAMTRNYDSGYKVVLEESTPGNASLVLIGDISLYHLFVWVHHYTAKDSFDPGKRLIDELTLIIYILFYFTIHQGENSDSTST